MGVNTIISQKLLLSLLGSLLLESDGKLKFAKISCIHNIMVATTMLLYGTTKLKSTNIYFCSCWLKPGEVGCKICILLSCTIGNVLFLLGVFCSIWQMHSNYRLKYGMYFSVPKDRKENQSWQIAKLWLQPHVYTEI